jgi:hypothetical protein
VVAQVHSWYLGYRAQRATPPSGPGGTSANGVTVRCESGSVQMSRYAFGSLIVAVIPVTLSRPTGGPASPP